MLVFSSIIKKSYDICLRILSGMCMCVKLHSNSSGSDFNITAGYESGHVAQFSLKSGAPLILADIHHDPCMKRVGCSPRRRRHKRDFNISGL